MNFKLTLININPFWILKEVTNGAMNEIVALWILTPINEKLVYLMIHFSFII